MWKFLQHLRSGTLSQELGCGISERLELSCIHFSGHFKSFPITGENPENNGIDNLNNVLRTFREEDSDRSGKIFDARLKKFLGVGPADRGRLPCFQISMPIFQGYMYKSGTRALSDGSLLQQLATCATIDNGISKWTMNEDLHVVSALISYYGDDHGTTLLVRLDPNSKTVI